MTDWVLTEEQCEEWFDLKFCPDCGGLILTYGTGWDGYRECSQCGLLPDFPKDTEE